MGDVLIRLHWLNMSLLYRTTTDRNVVDLLTPALEDLQMYHEPSNSTLGSLRFVAAFTINPVHWILLGLAGGKYGRPLPNPIPLKLSPGPHAGLHRALQSSSFHATKLDIKLNLTWQCLLRF